MNVKEKPILNVNKREILGKKVKSLRRDGVLPAVIYGKHDDSLNISIPEREFEKLYKDAGGNTIVLIKQEGEEDKNVLIHKVDRHPVNDKIIHIDLFKINMKEKITAKVPLHFTGDSKAEREMDGSLITNKSEVEVECLPLDLPHEIEVSIEVLDDFEKAIHVKDLVAPEGVTILDEGEETVATVEPPRSEEEMAELEEPVEEEIPEEEGEEKEGEEGEEVEGEGEEGEKPAESGEEEKPEEKKE